MNADENRLLQRSLRAGAADTGVRATPEMWLAGATEIKHSSRATFDV
jgi:hypothetical protein